MADLEGNVAAKDFGLDHPQQMRLPHQGRRPAGLRHAPPPLADIRAPTAAP